MPLSNARPNNILRILKRSAKSLCREEATARNTSLYTERVQAFLARYVAEVAESIASVLSLPVQLNIMSSTIPWERQAAVCVSLRVHGEPVQILLPVELAQDLIARVLKEEVSQLIELPSEDRLAVLAFLVARLLAESEQFLTQRIYVAEVKLIASEADFLQLGELRSLIELSATLKLGEYRSAVRFSELLVERIRAYAHLSPSSARARCVLEQARVSATLTLEFQAKSLMSVIFIKSGSFLPLDPVSLRGTLAWIHPTGDGAVRYPLKANVSGDRGALQFEITRKHEEHVCPRPISHHP